MLKKWLRERKKVEDDVEKRGIGSIDAFAGANMAIKIYSEILQENLFFVSNERLKNQVKGDGLVIYLPHELKNIIMLKLQPEDMKRLHFVKQVFRESVITDAYRT